ncbi:MAG TPA: NfeD family protein [Brevundimonas sp.]|nr:NfeD family protein [Brevundimonas sp.]
MDWIVSLHASQPFWLWLGIGGVLLGIEATASTEWLLWPAVSAGLTALLTAVAPQLGLPIEIGVFAALTVASTVMSRRLVKRVNPKDQPDINDRDVRLIGERARVVEAFVDGRGRVFVSGSEWPAEIEGAAPLAGESVIVESVSGPRLKVRAA